MKYLKITSKKNHHILSEWETVSNFEFDKKILNSGELVLKPEKVDSLVRSYVFLALNMKSLKYVFLALNMKSLTMI